MQHHLPDPARAGATTCPGLPALVARRLVGDDGATSDRELDDRAAAMYGGGE